MGVDVVGGVEATEDVVGEVEATEDVVGEVEATEDVVGEVEATEDVIGVGDASESDKHDRGCRAWATCASKSAKAKVAGKNLLTIVKYRDCGDRSHWEDYSTDRETGALIYTKNIEGTGRASTRSLNDRL